jgi:4-amino-4-deoxy-L-arabinose transferase-like glycosyltransferase
MRSPRIVRVRRSYFATGLALVAALLALLACLGTRADGMTWDEGRTLQYGVRLLQGTTDQEYLAFNSRLPSPVLNALPVVAWERVHGLAAIESGPQGLKAIARWALEVGRVVSIALGVMLVLVVALAARALAGDRAGLAAGLFAALEPNLLAHFHYVTADGPATLAVLLLVLATRRLARTRRARDAGLAGGALGLALLSKHMLVVLGPLALLALGLEGWRGGGEGRPRWTRGRVVSCLAGALLATLVTIGVGYGGRGLPGRFPENPRSERVRALVAAMGRPPLPLPREYLEGLDWTASDEETGRSYGNIYLLGEVREGRGFFSYYAVVLGVKVPLPLLLLVFAAWGRVLVGRRSGSDAIVLRTFALGYFLFLSFANRAQIGIRHALPVVPLLILEAATAFAGLWRTKRGQWGAAALVLWAAASVLSFAPDFLPYTNELISRRVSAYKVLADSNLDWGQAEEDAVEWVRARARAGQRIQYAPAGPVNGLVLVSVNALTGVTAPPERFAWLRARAPVGHFRHAYLLYYVAEQK